MGGWWVGGGGGRKVTDCPGIGTPPRPASILRLSGQLSSSCSLFWRSMNETHTVGGINIIRLAAQRLLG